MDGLGPTCQCRRHNHIGTKVTLSRLRAANMHCLIGHGDMFRRTVGIRINRHTGNPHRLRGGHHPTGDLTAIGDQDFFKHLQVLSRRICVSAFAARGGRKGATQKCAPSSRGRSHAKNAKPRILDRCSKGRGQRQPQDLAGFAGIDNAVIPKPCTGIQRV